jgi:hypothetical protein
MSDYGADYLEQCRSDEAGAPHLEIPYARTRPATTSGSPCAWSVSDGRSPSGGT